METQAHPESESLKAQLAHRDREIAVLRQRLGDADRAGIAVRLPVPSPPRGDEHFRTLADTLPQMVWSTRPDGYHDYYNRRWYDFTGMPDGSTDGEEWNGMFHPDDRQRARSRWQHALGTGEPYEIEYRLRHRSGAYRWVLGRALPVRNDAGAIVRWFGTCTDIDEFKRTAEALRANEEFTRRILDSSGDCIKVLSLDGTMQFMSGGGMRVMEVDDFAAIEGCDWSSFWTGPYHEQARAALETARSGGIGRFAGSTPTAKGTPKWWDVVVTPINGADGKPERILSISRDITEPKLAHEAVRQSEERYRLAARATNDAVWDWDIASGQVLWNEALQTLFGYPPDTIGEAGTWWKDHIHPEDRERVTSAIKAVIDGGGETWQNEYRFRRQDGAYASVFDRGYVLRDHDGAPLRMIGAMLDVTERKRHEETLELLNREMDHRIKNMFAVATSLTTLAAREAKTPKELATDLRERFATLARVHSFVRTQPHDMNVATLGELIKALLAPYHTAGAEDRVRVECLGVEVGPHSTTAVALIIHELATNAAKYGALSAAEGSVEVRCSSDAETATIIWCETGGPAVRRPETPEGFGSLLVRRSITDQLGGSVKTEWLEAGVQVTITAELARLAR